MVQPFGKQFAVPQNVKHRPYNLILLLLSVYPREMRMNVGLHRKLYMGVYRITHNSQKVAMI